MFSSLASFLFGSNTSSTTNSETNHNPIGTPENVEQQSDAYERIDAENTVQLTRSTPSVPGNSNNINNSSADNKRTKNKRGKYNRNKKGGQKQQKPTPSITKLLTPTESTDDDFDEDDWFIVEKEDEEYSLPRTDSEEELSVVGVKPKSALAAGTADNGQQAQQRPRHQIHSHSVYTGPRPQQQRNFRQRTVNSGARSSALNVSRLSPPRSIGAGTAAADGSLTQSLYISSQSREGQSGSDNENGANAMEESWFVTPPPCFTSIGPINMETSPFENLLIEHPSMSVYHSIRSAQEATESFVDLDLGVNESQRQMRGEETTAVVPTANGRNARVVHQRSNHVRVDHYSSTQLKQELFARNAQKSHDKMERQNLCRGAIKRANKVRDVQSKRNPQRRSDLQHCKIVSRANNNRKCCY